MLPIEEDSHRQECSRHDDKSNSKTEAEVMFQAPRHGILLRIPMLNGFGKGDLMGSIPIYIFFETYFHVSLLNFWSLVCA